MRNIAIDITPDLEGYETFIKCKSLPSYGVEFDRKTGRRQVLTDEVSYRTVFGGEVESPDVSESSPHLMKFQKDLVERALERRRFAIFADCGLGKTPMGLAWAVASAEHGKVLVLCPLAVLEQWKRELHKFHGLEFADLRRGDSWTDGLAIHNWESRKDIDMRGVCAVVLDESSILKNSSGETMKWITELTAAVGAKLALSATPAPNTHFEYASHAKFLGVARTVKEYASKYFKKDGVRWVLRGHAIEPFYANVSTWATYIHSPKALGYTESTEMPSEPSYRYTRTQVPDSFKSNSGELFGSAVMGEDRSQVFGLLRWSPGPRMDAIKSYAENKRCIVWASRNNEETAIQKAIGGVVINGPMPIEKRIELVDAYRAGEVQHIISKPKVLGFGVNIPECDHMVYSGFDYSFESFYQAVRRAHRYGRKGQLEVMIPYTDPEAAILTNLQDKIARFRGDVDAMQARFWK